MSLPLIVVAFLAGLIVGSFLNVVAIRVPAGRSVVRPPSACPACGAAIRPRDNVPVVGWMMLRGRCRDCGAAIGIQYPLVEGGTAVAFAITAAVIGPSGVLPAYLWFVAVTIVLILTDLDHKLIPNRILYPGTLVGLVALGAGSVVEGTPDRFVRGAASGAAFFGMLFVIALVARGGFGFGDVKLGFLLGLFTGYLGWGHAAVAFVLAFLLGGIVSVGLLVTRRKGRKDAIPFGPYLVLGAYGSIVFGEAILRWYLR